MGHSPARHSILATAGHVDHGKSALVRALTGTDPDRLPEERARGITIDLGFAELRLPAPPGALPPEELRVGVVDVPGHEDFIKNMVSGVGSIDAAMLVVAADDGWMPQTEEHLQILTYLGVRAGVVALSKIDLTTDEAAVVAAVRDRLLGTPLEHAPIVPTSVVTGRGLADLRGALADVLAAAPPPADIGKPRLPVDRVFSLKGVGTVVTGTLTGGTLHRGQSVVVHPTGVVTRVRTVQTHNREVDVGLPGSRVALNLPDLEPSAGRASRPQSTVRRGDVVTLAELGAPSAQLCARLTRSSRPTSMSGATRNDPPRPLKGGTLVQFHHASTAVPARVHFLQGDALEPGADALVRLTLESPVFVFAGDRFVLRDWPEQHTLAGGLVLDPDPNPTRRATAASTLAALDSRARHPDDPAVFVTTQLAHDRALPRSTLLTKSRFDRPTIDTAVAASLASGTAVAAGAFLVDPALWSELHRQAAALVDAHHGAHPEQTGLSLADLRSALAAFLQRVAPDVTLALLDALVHDLGRDGLTAAGTTIRRAAHRPALPPRLQAAGQHLRQQLARHPFDPPSRKELCPNDVAHQALKFLVATGEAVDLSPDVVLSTDAYTRAAATVRDHLRAHGPATVSELKTLLASSRRIMVPFLERLDRDGITRRDGDRRRLP
jgi:selenocysteine-specific elongation factor